MRLRLFWAALSRAENALGRVRLTIARNASAAGWAWSRSAAGIDPVADGASQRLHHRTYLVGGMIFRLGPGCQR